MRFLSSVALLSLAGLGLASPMDSGISKRKVSSGLLTREPDIDLLKDRDTHANPVPVRGRSDGEHGGYGQGVERKDGQSKSKCNSSRRSPCLRDEDVNELVDAYVRMLSHWDDADAKYLADSFSDWSDSINILAGFPLGGPTFPTKQDFINHEHAQPDNLPLVVTHKLPYNCNEIALIWQATFGVAQKQVRGVTIIGATKEEKGCWQIKRIDVEFNNLAYLLDIGGSYSLPPRP